MWLLFFFSLAIFTSDIIIQAGRTREWAVSTFRVSNTIRSQVDGTYYDGRDCLLFVYNLVSEHRKTEWSCYLFACFTVRAHFGREKSTRDSPEWINTCTNVWAVNMLLTRLNDGTEFAAAARMPEYVFSSETNSCFVN